MAVPGRAVAGVRDPAGARAADACQKSDGQDAGLQCCLTDDDLRGGPGSSGGGHRELGLDPAPTDGGQRSRRL